MFFLPSKLYYKKKSMLFNPGIYMNIIPVFKRIKLRIERVSVYVCVWRGWGGGGIEL